MDGRPMRWAGPPRNWWEMPDAERNEAYWSTEGTPHHEDWLLWQRDRGLTPVPKKVVGRGWEGTSDDPAAGAPERHDE